MSPPRDREPGGRAVAPLDRIRRENLGRLLVRTFDAFERDVLAGFRQRGIALKKTWLPVLRNVEAGGSRITEIADAAGLAKQTVGPLVRELEEEGILRVEVDPDDRRARLVCFTEAGLAGLRAGMEVLRETEARYAAALGARRMAALRDALQMLLDRFEERPEEP